MSNETSEDESPLGPPSEPPPLLPPPLPARPKKNIPAPPLPVQIQAKNMAHSLADDNDLECEQDLDEEISQQMTASYSEISFNSGGRSPVSSSDPAISLGLDQIDTPMALPEHIKQRPVTLPCERNQTALVFGPLDLEGTVHTEGNMTHFVAEDLEYKIKLSSPVTKKTDAPSFSGNSRSGTPSNLYRQLLVPQMVQVDANVLLDLETEAQRMATSIDNLTENLCEILHSISSITADNIDTYKDSVVRMSDAMDSNIKSMYTIIAKAEELGHVMKIVQFHAERIKEMKRLVDLFESNL